MEGFETAPPPKPRPSVSGRRFVTGELLAAGLEPLRLSLEAAERCLMRSHPSDLLARLRAPGGKLIGRIKRPLEFTSDMRIEFLPHFSTGPNRGPGSSSALTSSRQLTESRRRPFGLEPIALFLQRGPPRRNRGNLRIEGARGLCNLRVSRCHPLRLLERREIQCTELGDRLGARI